MISFLYQSEPLELWVLGSAPNAPNLHTFTGYRRIPISISRPFFPPLLIRTLLLQPAYHGSMVSNQTLPSSCHPKVLQGASSRRLNPSLRARTCIDVNTHDVISSLFDESFLSLSFTHRLDGLSSCFECIIPVSVPTVALIEQSSRPLN